MPTTSTPSTRTRRKTPAATPAVTGGDTTLIAVDMEYADDTKPSYPTKGSYRYDLPENADGEIKSFWIKKATLGDRTRPEKIRITVEIIG